MHHTPQLRLQLQLQLQTYNTIIAIYLNLIYCHKQFPLTANHQCAQEMMDVLPLIHHFKD